MINPRDLYIQTERMKLVIGNSTCGEIWLEYEVRAYTDLRNGACTRAYKVTATQRLFLTSPLTFSLDQTNKYDNYPAAAIASLTPAATGTSVTTAVLDYAPKTLNTAIMTSQNEGSSTDVTTSNEHTSGSSIAQTNSYDTSLSLGFFGRQLTGGGSMSESHSTTTETSASDSEGRMAGRGVQSAASSSMSIKDWGSFASVDPAVQKVTWTWGQEYPWNILQFHQGSGVQTSLPAYILARLGDGSIVFPPSDLSLYGADFIAHARWLVSTTPGGPDETVAFTSTVTLYQASHGYDGASLLTSLVCGGTAFSHTGAPFNLAITALDPITDEGPGNGAVINFGLQQFITLPAADAAFRITSNSNNLYAVGSGFTAPADDASPMTTDFQGGAVIITLSFKIISPTDEYALFLKHWKTQTAGCVIQVMVNGDVSNTLTRHVDAAELGNGSDNVTTVVLRSKANLKTEFFDYLNLGLNTLTITVTPSNDLTSGQPCGYALRGLAVG